MTITKKQLYSLIAILALTLFLPLVVYLLKGRFDIRPRALLAGAANFRLNADTTSLSSRQRMNVLVSVELTDANVRTSGVDFYLLYDSSKLSLISLSGQLGNNFTQTVIQEDTGQTYTAENGFNYLRLSMVSNKPKVQLSGGTIPLANVTFEAKQNGNASIKFPDDNTKLQVVGTTL